MSNKTKATLEKELRQARQKAKDAGANSVAAGKLVEEEAAKNKAATDALSKAPDNAELKKAAEEAAANLKAAEEEAVTATEALGKANTALEAAEKALENEPAKTGEAKKPETKSAQKTNGPTITIVSKREGFRRAGVTHSSKPTIHRASDFTEEQLEQLDGEPMLIITDE